MPGKIVAVMMSVAIAFSLFETAVLPGVARALDSKPSAEELQQSESPFARLSDEEERRLEMLLARWERGVESMERYRCKFRRWDFDSLFGPSDSEVAHTISTGVIQYASPDKLLYRVDDVKQSQAPMRAGDKWTYSRSSSARRQHWLYDGKTLFEFDHHNKQLIEWTMPPEMNGKAVGDRPPMCKVNVLFGVRELSLGTCYPLGGAECFVFGPKLGKIQDRFWLRVVGPQEIESEDRLFVLEAYPKAPSEKLNFEKVQLIVDPEDGLAKAMKIVFSKDEARRRGEQVVFEFTEREMNWELPADASSGSDFPPPELPSGWKTIDLP